jgi:hypothetical protein
MSIASLYATFVPHRKGALGQISRQELMRAQ